MRSTQKYINQLLDTLKYDLNLKSRAKASQYFYNVLGDNFKRKGYSLSYYMNNKVTITADDVNYIEVPYEYLWLQNTFISGLDKSY